MFSVLDQPRLLPAGVAAAFASFVLPAALAALLTLRSTCAADATAENGTSRPGLALGFAAVVMSALVGMVLLVVLLLGRMSTP